MRFLKVADAVYYVNESWSVMFFLDNFKENCQRNRLISNLNAFTCFCGINSVKIIENNRLGNGEKSQISTQIKSHVSWVRFRLVAHQIWDISGEAEFVSLSLRFNLSKSQVGGPRPRCSDNRNPIVVNDLKFKGETFLQTVVKSEGQTSLNKPIHVHEINWTENSLKRIYKLRFWLIHWIPTYLHCIADHAQSKYDQPTLYRRPPRCTPAQHTTCGERDHPRPFFNRLNNLFRSPRPLRAGPTFPRCILDQHKL